MKKFHFPIEQLTYDRFTTSQMRSDVLKNWIGLPTTQRIDRVLGWINTISTTIDPYTDIIIEELKARQEERGQEKITFQEFAEIVFNEERDIILKKKRRFLRSIYRIECLTTVELINTLPRIIQRIISSYPNLDKKDITASDLLNLMKINKDNASGNELDRFVTETIENVLKKLNKLSVFDFDNIIQETENQIYRIDHRSVILKKTINFH